MPHWTDEYLEMINDCEDRESRMNEWECGFCESIRERLEQEKTLSKKQIETLENIWEKVTKEG